MKVQFKVENLKNMTEQLKSFAEFLKAQDIAEEDVFLSRLVSSELISNVIRHGGESAYFCGELLEDKISISVTAPSQEGVKLTATCPSVLAESGRGLYIINEVSLGGIQRGEHGELIVFVKRTR